MNLKQWLEENDLSVVEFSERIAGGKCKKTYRRVLNYVTGQSRPVPESEMAKKIEEITGGCVKREPRTPQKRQLDPDQAALRKKAYDLREKGLTFREISKALGYNHPQSAKALYQDYLKRQGTSEDEIKREDEIRQIAKKVVLSLDAPPPTTPQQIPNNPPRTYQEKTKT